MNRFKESRFYWKWIKFDVDFMKYPDDLYQYNRFNQYELNRDSNRYKLRQGFEYVGLPINDNCANEWYDGGWSSQYNEALKYLIELGFIRKVDKEEL